MQNQAVAAAYREYAVGQTLIFTATVQHAHHIAEMIDGAVMVSADTPDRAEIIERFTKREIPCLVNCMIFTEGADMPLIETVIIARPTRNASLYTQMVGRGLRLHPDKTDLQLIDCVGITGKLNICTAPDLFGIGKLPKGMTQADIQGKRITEIEDMIVEVANRQPDWKINVQLVELFEQNGKYDTHNVNYIIMPDGSMLCSIGDKRVIKVRAEDITGNSYAYMVHDNTIVWTIQPAPMQEVLDGVYNRLVCDYQRAKNLWDLELVKRWGPLPATLSQLSYLKKLIRRSHRNDIRVDDNISKYEASVLIGQLA